MTINRPMSYRREKDGYTFVLDRGNIDRLRAIAEFEGREEPALVEDFLRFRVEGWAENLADAGASPGEVAVQLDSHQRKAHLVRGSSRLFSADI